MKYLYVVALLFCALSCNKKTESNSKTEDVKNTATPIADIKEGSEELQELTSTQNSENTEEEFYIDEH